MKTLYKKAVDRFNEAVFSYGAVKEPTLVGRIASEWQPFGVIKGDRAKMVDLFNDVFLVVLETPKGVFPKHYHIVNESGIMLKGSMRVNTPSESYIVNEGESYTIPANVWHEVEFLEDTNAAIAQFHPIFESGEWEANLE